LIGLKILVNVDGHDDNRFSGSRRSQPVSYSANARGLQKQTVPIIFIRIRINFKKNVRKVVDAHVEVILGTVLEFFLVLTYLNHKVERKLQTTVTSG